jgi:hypothetical protein
LRRHPRGAHRLSVFRGVFANEWPAGVGVMGQVAFSPTSGLLASGSWDKTVKVWDVTDTAKCKCVATLDGHATWVHSVAFSPTGGLLASGSWDKTIKVWDITNHLPVFGLAAVIRMARGLRDDMPGLAPALEELNRMIGLDSVKRKVARIVNVQLREPARTVSHINVQCLGPPGVGKSHAAKLIGSIFNECGLVQLDTSLSAKERFVKVSASDLIAG